MAIDAGRLDPTADPLALSASRGAKRVLPIREPRRATAATYETLEPLAAATEALTGRRRDSKKLSNEFALALQLRD